MGNCCGGTATVPSLSRAPAPPEVVAMDPMPPPMLSHVSADRSSNPLSQPASRSRSRTGSRADSTARSRLPPQDPDPRTRRKSAPVPPSSLPDVSRLRTKSAANPRNTARSESRPTGTGVRASTMSLSGRRSLTSTMEQVLTETPRFRILIVGNRGSGKSSLINAAFGVNISAALGGSDINLPFLPEENRRLVVHEYSGLGPDDAHGLRIIQDFITKRTNPNCAPAERLHAVWICIPTSDAIGGRIGEGVDEILNIRSVPVVFAFTKSDLAYPDISGSESGNYQYRDRTRTRADTQCNDLCLSLFRRDSRDVPAELVSVIPRFNALIHNLAVTTDRLIMGSRTTSSRSSSQGAKSRTAPGPLTWSIALRASQEITIQASIEIGRSRYWRNLWSSLDFTDQTLEKCVNVIHFDIIEIWNLNDRRKFLSSNQFKRKMSHVVKDLAIPAGGTQPSDWNASGDKLADWVYDVYRGSQENVRCMMGYIVNLMVILDDISRTASGSVKGDAALRVIDNHISSDHRDRIHLYIRSFVAETFSTRFATPEKDLALENIVNLIRSYCAPHNS